MYKVPEVKSLVPDSKGFARGEREVFIILLLVPAYLYPVDRVFFTILHLAHQVSTLAWQAGINPSTDFIKTYPGQWQLLAQRWRKSLGFSVQQWEQWNTWSMWWVPSSCFTCLCSCKAVLVLKVFHTNYNCFANNTTNTHHTTTSFGLSLDRGNSFHNLLFFAYQ